MGFAADKLLYGLTHTCYSFKVFGQFLGWIFFCYLILQAFEDTAKPLVIALAKLTFRQWPDILRILKVCTK